MEGVWKNHHEWPSYVSHHLGKKYRKQAMDIITNIVLTDLKAKPAYLLDVGVDSDALQNLLSDLYAKQIVSNYLNIIQLEMDLLIANPNFFSDNLLNNGQIIVDVSKARLKPVELSDGEIVIKSLSNFLLPHCKFSVDNTKVIKVENFNHNLTTCFGMCLGYPYVYWYEKESASSLETCLEQQPLCCYKLIGYKDLKCQCHRGHTYEHVIFSFSVPECVNHSIDEWVVKMKDILSKVNLFDNVKLVTDKKVLDSVLL